jgi:precorrin-6Y C5,15-methyltransferase (decarboxylating)
VNRVVIFAGTTEGRQIAQYLGNAGIDVLACVATEFGRQFIEEGRHVKVSSGRLGEDGMRSIMKEGCSCVIDATHPYASVITGKIKTACKETGTEYIRLVRPEGRRDDGLIIVPDVQSAVEYLNGTEGNILVTTGSKELEKYTKIKDHQNRVFARVLSMPNASQSCADIGFQGRNLFCMQGPFCEELNYGMLKQVDARYMVTKDSGEPGGFEEKINAARKAGVKIILVSRPEEESGNSLEEVIELLSKRFGIKTVSAEPTSPRKLSIIGIGMGNEDTLTIGAKKVIDEADLLIGAERMVRSMSTGQDSLIEYRAEPIISYINENQDYRKIAVLVSGDTGFQSAAAKIIEKVNTSGIEIDVICGISSIAYLCSKIGSSWDDAYLMSAHGRDANVIGAVCRNNKVIVLLSGSSGAKALCKDLTEYGMDNVIVSVGQDLGQENERITKGKPSDIQDTEFGTLCIAIIENPYASKENPIGIQDDLFIRGEAPMTKEEIRSLSVIKLKLEKNSVMYDIGAGTGSVAIESALSIPDGKVYAIEK